MNQNKKSEKQKITKDIVPEDFTLGLALVDAIPVIFFGAAFISLGMILKSWLFILGAALCLLGGAGKVLWKVIVVFQKKNVWPLFIQMRILMPLGFLLMVIAVILCRNQINFSAMWTAVTGLPQLIFFIAGIILMCCMMVFAFTLNGSKANANWIEQLTNGIAQLCFFLGILLILL